MDNLSTGFTAILIIASIIFVLFQAFCLIMLPIFVRTIKIHVIEINERLYDLQTNGIRVDIEDTETEKFKIT